MEKEIFDKVKEQFLAHADPLIARDVRRLVQAGELLLDEGPYRSGGVDFIAALSGACPVKEKSMDLSSFDAWYEKYDYKKIFPNYCKTYTDERLLRKKAFEHWLSIEETSEDLSGDFLDVGCATSPFYSLWEQFPSNPASKCYQVDLPLPEYGYLPGVNGNVIGSTADNIPLPDASVARIYSHNAIEHFEGNAYVGFFIEAARLLKPGGVIFVCPLFVATKTFAYVSLTGIYRRLSFPVIPRGVDLVYSEKVGQPYALQIDAEFLRQKILSPLGDKMDFEIFHYSNDVVRKEYGVRWAMKGTKRE